MARSRLLRECAATAVSALVALTIAAGFVAAEESATKSLVPEAVNPVQFNPYGKEMIWTGIDPAAQTPPKTGPGEVKPHDAAAKQPAQRHADPR